MCSSERAIRVEKFWVWPKREKPKKCMGGLQGYPAHGHSSNVNSTRRFFTLDLFFYSSSFLWLNIGRSCFWNPGNQSDWLKASSLPHLLGQLPAERCAWMFTPQRCCELKWEVKWYLNSPDFYALNTLHNDVQGVRYQHRETFSSKMNMKNCMHGTRFSRARSRLLWAWKKDFEHVKTLGVDMLNIHRDKLIKKLWNLHLKVVRFNI